MNHARHLSEFHSGPVAVHLSFRPSMNRSSPKSTLRVRFYFLFSNFYSTFNPILPLQFLKKTEKASVDRHVAVRMINKPFHRPHYVMTNSFVIALVAQGGHHGGFRGLIQGSDIRAGGLVFTYDSCKKEKKT